MKTLIRKPTIILPNPRGGLPIRAEQISLLIEGSKIAAIDPPGQTEVDQTIDGTGLFLLPGMVDDQVHFREPGLTHKEDLRHASRACAAGGITSYLEMPNTIPPATTQNRLNEKLALASRHSLVNYGFYIGATPDNYLDLKHATRTPGIKIFIGSSTGDLLVDSQQALERIFSETTLPICAHCEDERTVRENAVRYADSTDVADHSKIRDVQAAITATRRAIDLATRHQHPFHILHVSTGAEVELIQQAPTWVTAEVCPHHLFFNIDDYARLGSLIKMNPSIKTKQDNQRLWQALLDGDITVIATDHAPHTLEEKQLPFPQCPSGLPAVENSLALILNQVNMGNCSLEQVVFWMSQEPARIWNLKSKGKIQVGADADLVLVDLQRTKTIINQQQYTKTGWSPWEGTELQGWAVATWVMGHQVYDARQGTPQMDETKMGSEIEFFPPARVTGEVAGLTESN